MVVMSMTIFLCRLEALQSSVGEIQSVTGEHLICILGGIFDCPLWGLSSQDQCKGTELLLLQSRGTGCKTAAYAPCMLTQVLPLVAEQWYVDDLC